MYNQMNAALSSMPGFESWSLSGSWYEDEKGDYILGLFAANYDEMEEGSIDPDSEEGKKVTKAVSKAFEVDKDTLDEGGNTTSVDVDLDISDDGGTRYETQNGERVFVTENGGSVEIP